MHSRIRAHFLSFARSKLKLCSANHRSGYFSNLACDWLSIVWAYSEQETENGPADTGPMLLASVRCLPRSGLRWHSIGIFVILIETYERSCKILTYRLWYRRYLWNVRFTDVDLIFHDMMTSSNGNIFLVTGPLCGEFTGPGEFPAQRPVTRSFDVFFHLRLNKRLSKQPRGWWFETPPWSLWRQCNE